MIEITVSGREPADRQLRSDRAALAWSAAIAGLATFVGLSAMAWHGTGPKRWELPVISLARRTPAPAALTWEHVFQPKPFVVITVVLAVVALIDRQPVLALAGTAGCFLATFAGEYLLKPVIDSRQAPQHYRWYHPAVGLLTFPSGHVTAAASVATFAWLILRRRSPLALVAFVLPGIVAWAMVSLDRHTPLDTLGGLVLGPLVVAVVVAGASRLSARGRPVVAATTVGHPSERGPCGSS